MAIEFLPNQFALKFLALKVKISCRLPLLAGRVRTLCSEMAFPVTLSHNLAGISLCKSRVLSLLDPLLGIESISKDSSVLVVFSVR